MTKYVQRARDAGLGWPLPPDVDEARLEALLFPHAAPAVERYAKVTMRYSHVASKTMLDASNTASAIIKASMPVAVVEGTDVAANASA